MGHAKNPRKNDKKVMANTTLEHKLKNIMRQCLPRFEKNEDGTLNREKLIEPTRNDALRFHEKSKNNGKYGPRANMNKKKQASKNKGRKKNNENDL